MSTATKSGVSGLEGQDEHIDAASSIRALVGALPLGGGTVDARHYVLPVTEASRASTDSR